MRLGAQLASAEFASLSWRGATGRAMDCENLFGSHNFLHSGKDDAPNRRAGMVNIEQVSKKLHNDLRNSQKEILRTSILCASI
jgi:hypothetical protein